MSKVEEEIFSQPKLWRMVKERAAEWQDALPAPGCQLAVVGCGTSYYIGRAFAAAREARQQGETDAFAASEFLFNRRYDTVLVISRSGTTAEVLRVLERVSPETRTVAISAVPGSPVTQAVHRAVVLREADEESIVQTRFATSTLALLRAHTGEDLTAAIDDGLEAVAAPLPIDPGAYHHYVFLGQRQTTGLAQEAALKLQEMANVWTEAYPAMEYRHGPISVAGPRSLVWTLGTVDTELISDISATGATVVNQGLDPMAELVIIQRTAAALARARKLDPDRPRHLTRSVT
jgi:fructoselysine-6-P-deglycase FrlB-like protein